MRKRIILLGFIGLVITSLAYSGYKYKSEKAREKDPVVEKTVKTDLFAINELIAVIKKYEQANSLEANFITRIISEDGKKVLESFEGKYVKDSSGLYIKSYESENLLTRDYLIAIDNSEKVIYVEKPEIGSTFPFLQHGFLSDVDSLVNLDDSLIFYQMLNSQTAKLTMEIPSGNYYKTEFIYDIESKELKELRLYPYDDVFDYETDDGEVNENGMVDLSDRSKREENLKVSYVSIEYSRMLVNQPVNKKWIVVDRVFTQKGNKIELKNQYKNYEIEFE